MADYTHTPVLLKEVIDLLHPQKDKFYVDATFGGGGYTKAILEKADCTILGIDRDHDAVKRAHELSIENSRFSYAHAPFSRMEDVFCERNLPKADGIIFDLGVSSYQIDDPDRGFSFRFDGPLSMQMGCNNISAYDIVNFYSEKEIADILYQGEERFARRIARTIVEKRGETPITTTKQLAQLVASATPKSKDAQHPATLTFQALRIFVNNELKEIEKALSFCKNILNIDGKLIVVTFHSLEDRLVKQFFKKASGRTPLPSRYTPIVPGDIITPDFKLITTKPIIPSDQEIEINPRSRSAKLRYAIRERT